MTWTTAVKKAVAYRIFGTCLTGLIILAVGGTLELAGILALLDAGIRTSVYIIFEKVWSNE